MLGPREVLDTSWTSFIGHHALSSNGNLYLKPQERVLVILEIPENPGQPSRGNRREVSIGVTGLSLDFL